MPTALPGMLTWVILAVLLTLGTIAVRLFKLSDNQKANLHLATFLIAIVGSFLLTNFYPSLFR